MVESEAFLRLIFPSWLFDHFELVNFADTSHERMDIYLDEKKIIPSEFRGRAIIAYGFTDEYTVQDFPVRGKEVYLHLRRRKWMLLDTKEIVSKTYDVAYQGTRLTNEFVAFLKETNRE